MHDTKTHHFVLEVEDITETQNHNSILIFFFILVDIKINCFTSRAESKYSIWYVFMNT